jgi:HNH endonuclease
MVAAKQTKLTAERLRERLHYDAETGVFTRRVGSSNARAGDVAGSVHSTGYVRISIDGGKYTAHCLAWFYVHGVWPSDQIDHINRNRSDNRIANLRERRHRVALLRPASQTVAERDAYFASLVAERKQRSGW